MAKSSYVRRNWKLLLNITTLEALGVLVYAIRDQFAETFRNLFRVNAWALLLMIPVQYLNYDAQTRLYQHLFGLVGNKLSFWPIMRPPWLCGHAVFLLRPARPARRGCALAARWPVRRGGLAAPVGRRRRRAGCFGVGRWIVGGRG